MRLAADAAADLALYAADATLQDPAGGRLVAGRAAIRRHFAPALTEQREMVLVLMVITDHHAAVHFRATPADDPHPQRHRQHDLDEQAITTMHAYAS